MLTTMLNVSAANVRRIVIIIIHNGIFRDIAIHRQYLYQKAQSWSEFRVISQKLYRRAFSRWEDLPRNGKIACVTTIAILELVRRFTPEPPPKMQQPIGCIFFWRTVNFTVVSCQMHLLTHLRRVKSGFNEQPTSTHCHHCFFDDLPFHLEDASSSKNVLRPSV